MYDTSRWLQRRASRWLKGSRVRGRRAARFTTLEELESRSFPGSAMALLTLLSDWSQDDRTQAIPPTSAAAQDISKQSYVQTSDSTQDSPAATPPTWADAAAPAS